MAGPAGPIVAAVRPVGSVPSGAVRIWDLEPELLCRQHLLGEHRELHGLWNVLTLHGGTGGYARHPETLRWAGRTRALYLRHERLVAEMRRRGYAHRSELDERHASGARRQTVLLDSPEVQRALLTAKACDCLLPATSASGRRAAKRAVAPPGGAL